LIFAVLSIVIAVVSVLYSADNLGIALSVDDGRSLDIWESSFFCKDSPVSELATSLLDNTTTRSEAWVDDDYYDGGDNDGHTWGFDAFDKIQDGINAVSGSIVHVADGTYYENIVLKDGVQVLGSGPDTTIIDGTRSGSVVIGVNLGNTTKLDGLTVINGSASYGGGINLLNSSPIVSNCVISDNLASDFGGGMQNKDGSSPTIINCTFMHNSASKSGGGMRNYNSSSPTIINSAFWNDSASGDGGGLVNDRSSPVIVNCVFADNSASDDGGGIYNTAYSSPTIINSTFWNNSASDKGQSMYSTSSCSPMVANSILWNGTGEHIAGPATVSYSDIEGVLYPGAGNINASPVLADAWNGDFHLSLISPCIDEGNNDIVPTWLLVDFESDVRIIDGDSDGNAIVDMGVDEYYKIVFIPTPTPEATPTLTPTSTPSPTPSATPEPSPTLEPTETPSPTPTTTPTPVPTMTPPPTPETTPTPTPAPTPSPSPTPQPTATPGGTVASKGDMLINEVQYNPPQSGTDTAYEWFELYNNRSETIEMVGWGIRDNGGYDAISSMTISAHGFVVVVATDNFSVNFPDYSGTIVFISDGRIGNGLGNEGDCLILIDSSGNTIDELSYGSDITINSSWMKKVTEGHSMERQPAGGSFIDNSEPTPGFGLLPPAPTPVPTPTPSSSPVVSPTPVIPGTVASRSDILVNEVQYNPPQSNSESAYEWLELYNTLDHVVSLSGWRISDNYGSDAISFVNISPHGFAVVAASRSFYENYPNCLTAIIFIDDGCIGNGLGNNGDCVVLRDSDDNVIDAFSYGDDDSITSTPFKRVGEGHSMERRPAGGEFVENMEPAPGGGLTAPTSTPQASPVSTNTSSGTVANRSAVLINEVQNNPLQSGSDSSWEWIELYNPGAEAVELIGWGIGDNHETDEIPLLNVSAGSLIIVAASENFSDNFPDYDGAIVFIADGRIGNGLGNGGDHLVLKDSAGAIIDETSYGDDESLTVSPLLDVADGHSLERAPCGGQFIDNDVPTPGSCLSVISSCIDPAASAQVPPMSDLSESTTINQQQSTDISRSANARAYTSSSIDQATESPGLSLSALLVTLSLSLISMLGWMLYRRKSR
jgi:hypothetical protein